MITESEALDALLPLGFTQEQIKFAVSQTGSNAQSIEEIANFIVLTLPDPSAAQQPSQPVLSNYSEQHQNAPHKLVLIVNSALKMSQGSTKSTVRVWLDQGEPIIVVQSGNDSLLDLEKRCLANGLPVYKIHDAGRTEVASGSLTVLAVGPAPNSEMDVVTRSLSLLK
ncbi:hypothetical protein CcCBS67573_g03016 [Chytriomyces confervae]|uniref:peptidyl-tRNA hydrolase n=1 Tax=Chytriomyces confervae TaxID=246404 RepID=A0A507FHM9_9FUNG|nr:hypothetical protein CcCBS67573_g03016 [Chytriomyces confervae]